MTEEKSLRTIVFSGKRSDWDGWHEKMEAKMEWLGCRKLLLGEKDEATFDVVPSKATIDEIEEKTTKSADDKKILKLQELNKIAYMHLVLSMDTSTREGKAAFRLIKNTKSAEYPDGNCKLAWDRLKFRYASKAAASLMRLKKTYENSVLEPKRDPELWISHLESIISEIEAIDESSAPPERDLMLHVLNNLTPEYECVLDDLENQFNDGTLTLEHIREKLSGRYERIKENRREKVLEERVMGAVSGKQFKGLCNHCGKYGHKAAWCPEKEGEAQHFLRNGKCWFCGSEEHKLFKYDKFVAAKAKVAGETSDFVTDELGNEEYYDFEIGL